jgi:hypothetical protein
MNYDPHRGRGDVAPLIICALSRDDNRGVTADEIDGRLDAERRRRSGARHTFAEILSVPSAVRDAQSIWPDAASPVRVTSSELPHKGLSRPAVRSILPS